MRSLAQQLTQTVARAGDTYLAPCARCASSAAGATRRRGGGGGGGGGYSVPLPAAAAVRRRAPVPAASVSDAEVEARLEEMRQETEAAEAAAAGGDGPQASPAPPPPPGPRVSLDVAAPLVSVASDAAFAPLPPGAPRRYSWPLFGTTQLPAVTPAQAALAARLFQRGSRYLGDQHDFVVPGGGGGREPAWTELVVVGRSNAGKSTLLNRLLGAKGDTFVRVSRRPGSTTHLDWYGLGTSAAPAVAVVDTPGYGYSVRGKGAGDAWLQAITDYLGARSPGVLGRTLVLLDARHGLTPVDVDVLGLLEERMVPWHCVLTKVDAVSAGQLEATARTVASALARSSSMAFPVLSAVSGRTGEGLRELAQMAVLSAKLHRRVPPPGGSGGGGGKGRPPAGPGGGSGKATGNPAEELDR
jgi:GTP-binding protein